MVDATLLLEIACQTSETVGGSGRLAARDARFALPFARDITYATQCPVCGGDVSSRFRVDNRRSELTEWNDAALQSLWHAVQETVRTHGEGWTLWRPVTQAAAQKPLPHKLQQEEVPSSVLRASKEGGYHSGKYQSIWDVQCKEQAREEIQRQWATDRLVRIDLLQEQEEGQGAAEKTSQ